MAYALFDLRRVDMYVKEYVTNVDMDLAPFLGINPCGYAGLHRRHGGLRRAPRAGGRGRGAGAQSGCRLAPRTARRSAANPPVSRLNASSDAAFAIRFPARSFSSDMKSITAADISATTPAQLAALRAGPPEAYAAWIQAADLGC